MSFSKFNLNLHFPSVVGFKKETLDQMAININSYYQEWEKIKIDKKTCLPKTYKDGTVKKRYVRPSTSKLKVLQSKIKKQILERIELPENVHGGVKKKSNITNAKKHQGNKYLFVTDLQEFFPSIKTSMVSQTFSSLGFNSQFVFYMSRFTTWKGEVPQGASTSTHIANIVFLKTDKVLIDFCAFHKITYTRYIDDLTFSSQQNFQKFIPNILNIITNTGFKISWRKTSYASQQMITGIIAYNNKIDLDTVQLEKVKAEKLLPPEIPKYLTIYRERLLKTNRKQI